MFYSPAKPNKQVTTGPSKKFLDTEPFVSENYKPVPEVFICYGYEEFFDLERDRPKGSKEYVLPLNDLLESRKKFRGGRLEFRKQFKPTENTTGI